MIDKLQLDMLGFAPYFLNFFTDANASFLFVRVQKRLGQKKKLQDIIHQLVLAKMNTENAVMIGRYQECINSCWE